jgi:hypothetical protein
MDVNEHERLSNFTLRHKLKLKSNAFIDFFYIINKNILWKGYINIQGYLNLNQRTFIQGHS